MLQNLSPTFGKNLAEDFYQGKMETFLTCRKLAENLRENILTETAGNFFEEAALEAVYKTLSTNVTIPDLRLLFSELPNILQLDYPAVENIRTALLKVIPQLMHIFRINNIWKEFTELEYLLNMLKICGEYNKT